MATSIGWGGASPAVPEPTDSPSGSRCIRLLDLDPAFATGIPAAERQLAQRFTLAELVDVPAGRLDARRVRSARRPFALSVACGLLVRDLQLSGRTSSQLVGPGDVLRLGQITNPDVRCYAVAGTRLAVLDGRFLEAGRRWPTLTVQFTDRVAQWADRALVIQAIVSLPRTEDRITELFKHLAARWGRATDDGVVVPLRITHNDLGRLVGAQRPTVSLALKELALEHVLIQTPQGWLAPSVTAHDGPSDHDGTLHAVEEAALRTVA